jgi:glycosyltransferase involved in cell wall biosynthesis
MTVMEMTIMETAARYTLAVIIATKDRSEAIRTISLPSLAQSTFRDFVCLVWDASQDETTRDITENGNWPFAVFYTRAPRVGLASQRNDAVLCVREKWPNIQYIVFIDDDTELSSDALEGVHQTFQDSNVGGINIPFASDPYASSRLRRVMHRIFRSLLKAPGRGVLLPCCYFYLAPPEIKGAEVDWTMGCGMAFRMEIFSTLNCFFPEPFQRFGGYTEEDGAFSFHLKHCLKQKIVNSVCGTQIHHRVPGGRINVKNLFALRWYDGRLLFDDIYGGYGHRFPYCWRLWVFKSFYVAHFFWDALHGGGLDVFRGLWAASRALRHEREKIAGRLFEYGFKYEMENDG